MGIWNVVGPLNWRPPLCDYNGECEQSVDLVKVPFRQDPVTHIQKLHSFFRRTRQSSLKNFSPPQIPFSNEPGGVDSHAYGPRGMNDWRPERSY
jgi:hypothetical protein